MSGHLEIGTSVAENCIPNFSAERLVLSENISPAQRADFLLQNANTKALGFDGVFNLGDLAEGDASVLTEYDKFSANERVARLTLNEADLPDAVLGLIPQEVVSAGMVTVIASENDQQFAGGMHIEPLKDGPLYYVDENDVITDRVVDDRSVILLNVSNNGKSLLRLPPDRVEEIIFNEYGHRVTERVREQFELAYSEDYVGRPFSEAPTEEEISAAILQGFLDHNLPRDDFSYMEMNELTSDAFSLTAKPDSAESLILRLSDLSLSSPNYQLSRDLYLQSLNEFRDDTNQVTLDSAIIEAKLARLSELHGMLEESDCEPVERVALQAEKEAILALLETDNPEFQAYLQSRFASATRDFYTHVLQRAVDIK